MRTIRIPTIRLDKTNVDAPTINRALDNIISNVNTLASETVTAIAGSSSPVKDIIGGVDIGVTNVNGVYTINYTGAGGGVSNITAGTGISVSNVGSVYTISNAGALLSGPAQTFTNDNTFTGNTNIVGPVTTFDGAITQLAAGRTFTNNGTFAGGLAAFTTYQNLPVDNILGGSGIAVSESPTGTFSIINTAQGGGGGGGIVYYLNGNIAGDPPLPAANTKELGISVQPTGTSTTVTLPNTGAWTTINYFITDTGVPNSTTIPAGIWDFNVWMDTTAIKPDEVAGRIWLYTWDSVGALIAVGVSSPVLITNHTTTSQYTFSVIVPQTTITTADRFVVLLEGHVLGSNTHTITANYGNTYPSHVHSTMPYPYVSTINGGTGVTVSSPSTGVYNIAIGQAVGTSDNVTFGGVTATSLTTPSILSNANLLIKPAAAATTAYTTTLGGGFNTSGVGGAVFVTAGNGTAAAGGSAYVDSGTGTTNGSVFLGTSNANLVSIGRSGQATTINSNTLNVNSSNIVPGTSLTIQQLSSALQKNISIIAGQNSVGVGGNIIARSGQGVTLGGDATFQGGLATAGAGGAATLAGGNSIGGGAGGAVYVYGGGTSAAFAGGNINLIAGSGTPNGQINIGASSTSAVNIAVAGITTNINGPLAAKTVVADALASTGLYAGGTSVTTFGGGTAGTPLIFTAAPTVVGGIVFNNTTGLFTVPATGLYYYNLTGGFWANTIPATTYWTVWELYDNAAPTVALVQIMVGKQVASATNMVAWATGDNFDISGQGTVSLTAGASYAWRGRNNTAAGNLVVVWTPTLNNANTARKATPLKLSMWRLT